MTIPNIPDALHAGECIDALMDAADYADVDPAWLSIVAQACGHLNRGEWQRAQTWALEADAGCESPRERAIVRALLRRIANPDVTQSVSRKMVTHEPA